MPNSKPPKIKICTLAGLKYQDDDKFDIFERALPEPEIEDDRVSVRIAVKLSKATDIKKISLALTYMGENEDIMAGALVMEGINADRKALKENSEQGQYIHFSLKKLHCKERFSYQILYKGMPLAFPNLGKKAIIFKTPPARKDPQPVKIACGGDQERHEQFNPFAACLGLDNQKDTARLYQHIGQVGKNSGSEDRSQNGEEEPYSLFIHLGDLFNGEYYFSFANLFRSGRKFFEHHVKSRKAFRKHLESDFVAPVGMNLAFLLFYAVLDDHDLGANNIGPPKTKKERKIQQKMIDSFNELLLTDDFLQEPRKKGPYYSLRIGQTEIFFLHNRYTRDEDSETAYMLGEEQWTWLETMLERSQASHKIIVSPLPFVMGKNPQEDYRGHWQEWHRFMQLCFKYKIATILTADSHNFSLSEIHVRSQEGENPWVVHQHLVGTLGGNKQSITKEEKACIEQVGRPPLLPTHPEFDSSLYQGSTVKAYFSPGDKRALIPQENTDSVWLDKTQWSKGTHAYGAFLFSPPQVEQVEYDSSAEDDSVIIEEPNKDHYSRWQAKFSLFTCSKKQQEVRQDERFNTEFST